MELVWFPSLFQLNRTFFVQLYPFHSSTVSPLHIYPMQKSNVSWHPPSKCPLLLMFPSQPLLIIHSAFTVSLSSQSSARSSTHPPSTHLQAPLTPNVVAVVFSISISTPILRARPLSVRSPSSAGIPSCPNTAVNSLLSACSHCVTVSNERLASSASSAEGGVSTWAWSCVATAAPINSMAECCSPWAYNNLAPSRSMCNSCNIRKWDFSQ